MGSEIDPVGVVDDAIEDGVGVGGIADELVQRGHTVSSMQGAAAAACRENTGEFETIERKLGQLLGAHS